MILNSSVKISNQFCCLNLWYIHFFCTTFYYCCDIHNWFWCSASFVDILPKHEYMCNIAFVICMYMWPMLLYLLMCCKSSTAECARNGHEFLARNIHIYRLYFVRIVCIHFCLPCVVILKIFAACRNGEFFQ